MLRDGSRVVAERRSFGTVCHGAGRVLSRTNARKGLAEEAPFAYKDVERVVAVVERAGLARRVAQLRPPGVVKG